MSVFDRRTVNIGLKSAEFFRNNGRLPTPSELNSIIFGASQPPSDRDARVPRLQRMPAKIPQIPRGPGGSTRLYTISSGSSEGGGQDESNAETWRNVLPGIA